jgi:thiol:disulfide interchange protein
MKKFGLLIVFLGLALISNAQQIDPVKWKYSVKKTGDCTAELSFSATVDAGWHLYSQENPPNPTYFDFKKSGSYKLVGKTIEPTPHKENDEYLGPVAYFKSANVTFTQKIELNSNQPFKVTGELGGQACQEDGVCIPLQVNFSFDVDPAGVICVKDPNDSDGDGTMNKDDKCPDAYGSLAALGCPDSDEDGVVDSEDKCPEVAGTKENGGCSTTGSKPEKNDTSDVPLPQKLDQAKFEGDCGDGEFGDIDKSFLGIFLAGFLGGLLALLTPCVFPMIPMTVSFFTKQSKTRAKGIRNAAIYALSIIVIYTGLGLLVTVIAGEDALNNMASSAFWNLLFFVVFVIFGASFLGAFEITLPSKFVNAVDKGSNRGGLIGIFFMAFTLSLVSFSCTGPIIGSLLVEASRGGFMGPFMGMFGFSLALALPFAVFAAFPGWLQSLPKSGGWLNSVKVILGFLELALALKFLSTVDLAYHWGFLKRELFLAVWITISVLAGLYLLGTFKLSHDSDAKPKLSVVRISFAILFFGMGTYMLPGLFGAPVNLFSGYLPPSYYKEWKQDLNGDFAECPHGMECYHDYEEGMKVARNREKPVLLDFTGYACVNCRKMEDNVWIKPQIFKLLTEEYVVVSLYVDDKRSLPKDQVYKSLDGKRTLKTYGDKWKDLQTYFFNANAQPYYVLVDNKGKLLARPKAYTPDVEEYKKFLDAGLCRYELRKNAVTGS